MSMLVAKAHLTLASKGNISTLIHIVVIREWVEAASHVDQIGVQPNLCWDSANHAAVVLPSAANCSTA